MEILIQTITNAKSKFKLEIRMVLSAGFLMINTVTANLLKLKNLVLILERLFTKLDLVKSLTFT
jgi:hypothetical protein